MAIKVGELYVEIYPKINTAARKAAMAGIEKSFRDMYNKIDNESSDSANHQIGDVDRVRNRTKQSTDEQGGYWHRFHSVLQSDMKKTESFSHALATRFRTFGTILRGLSLGSAVIGGLRLVTIAVQGIIALMPVLQAGLLSIPFAIGAIGAEVVVLKIAFAGVGKAIGLAFDPTKAKQYQAALEKLSPSARKFVQNIARAVPILKGLQESLFAAPALQRASARFGTFVRGLRVPLNRLAADNGNLIGRILGTFTDNKGLKLSIAFINNLGKIIRGVTPGLSLLTRAMQILAVKVSVELAKHIGGVNDVLEKLAKWLAHIDVGKVFDRAISVIKRLKPAAENIWHIFTGISKALGGWQGSSKDFIASITEFTGKVSAYVNSKAGQIFVRNLVDVVKSLTSLVSGAILSGISLLGLALQILAGPLASFAKWARENPGQFKVVAIAITSMYTAFKLFRLAVAGTTLALRLFRPAMIAADVAMNANVVGAILVAIVALGVALYLLIKHFKAVTAFLRGPWGTAITLALVVLMPFIGIPLLIMAHFTQLLNFFKGPFLHIVLAVFNAVKQRVLITVNAIIHWFTVSLPNAAKIVWANMVRFWNAILSTINNVKHGILVAVNALVHWFTVSLPNAAKILWANMVRYWNGFLRIVQVVKNGIGVAIAAIGHWFTVSVPNAAKFLWTRIFAYWNLIRGYTNNLKNWIITAFNAVLHFFTGPVYGGLKKLAGFALSIWRTMYGNLLRYFVNPIKGAFNSLVANIKTIWTKVQSYIGGPIKWVVDKVYNHGIAPLWNAVSNVVGKVLGHLGQIKLGFSGGGAVGGGAPSAGRGPTRAALAGGGFLSPSLLGSNYGGPGGKPVRGAGGPTEDLIPALLSHGEYVMKASVVRQLGTSFFDNLNANGRLVVGGDPSAAFLTTRRFASGGSTGFDQGIQRWAKGDGTKAAWGLPGPKKADLAGVHNTITGTLAWLKGIAGRIPYVLGANGPNAFDCSSLVGEVWARLTKHPSNHRYFVTGTEGAFARSHGFKKGTHLVDSLQIGWNGHHTTGALAGHPFEAAHTGTKMRFGNGATSPLTFPNKMYLPVGKGGSLLSGVLGFIANLAGKGLTYLSKPILWLLNKIPGVQAFRSGKLGATVSGTGKGGMFPTMIAKMAGAINKQVDKKEAEAEAALAAAGGGPGGGAPTNLKLGRGKFNSWVVQASKYVNLPASWLPWLLKIMSAESGGNPNAVNRSDSNARAGHPSQGLMQLIPSTFLSNVPPALRGLGIRNPVANVAAAVNYIHRRYGTIFNTPWARGTGTYYNQGGPVGGPLLRDNGGVLPPGDWLVQNHTGHDEYISKSEGGIGRPIELHLHVADKEFVHVIDDRIAGWENAIKDWTVKH